MSQHSLYLATGALWTLGYSLVVLKTGAPTMELYGPASLLALGLVIGTWVVFVSAVSESVFLKRLAQAANFSIPLIWALWVTNVENANLGLATWAVLAFISLVGNAVQEPGLLLALRFQEQSPEQVSAAVLEAVRPVVSSGAALDTGSLRIPS